MFNRVRSLRNKQTKTERHIGSKIEEKFSQTSFLFRIQPEEEKPKELKPKLTSSLKN